MLESGAHSDLSDPPLERIRARLLRIRETTEALTAQLSAEDCQPQSMPLASPVKWHLAHTNWFFMQFLLEPAGCAHWPDASWQRLFNSYYVSVGPRHARPQRGILTRPSLDEVREWRAHTTDRLAALLAAGRLGPDRLATLELGLQHEQQHQELILMDLKHLFAQSELLPVYRAAAPAPAAMQPAPPMRWVSIAGGLREQGFAGDGFAFDNERPRHRVYVEPCALGSRLVTNGEYLRFVEERGYEEPLLWLSEGWDWVQRERITAPLYWRQQDGAWHEFTLSGLQPLEPSAPVVHVSGFEADAFARWAGARLPREEEWEAAAAGLPVAGNFLERGRLRPAPAPGGDAPLQQMFGDVWEWTGSAYAPYPGFVPNAGALGEYNAKFMVNQLVLRGGCCVTPDDHVRATYRNFFAPDWRWQFSGIRLARAGGAG